MITKSWEPLRPRIFLIDQKDIMEKGLRWGWSNNEEALRYQDRPVGPSTSGSLQVMAQA